MVFGRLAVVALLAALAPVSADGSVHAVALFEYSAHDADELSLTKGESLIILDEAVGDDGWAYGRRTTNGAVGLLPLSHVRLIPPASSESIGSAGSAFSIALNRALAAAVADDDDPSADPGLRAAMRAYRQRRATYNGNAELLEQRWGVRFHDGTSGSAGGRSEPTEHRSGMRCAMAAALVSIALHKPH